MLTFFNVEWEMINDEFFGVDLSLMLNDEYGIHHFLSYYISLEVAILLGFFDKFI